MRSYRRRLVHSLIILCLLMPLLIVIPVAHASRLPVRYFSQFQGQESRITDCGPASVAMVVEAYGKRPPGLSDGAFITQVRRRMGYQGVGATKTIHMKVGVETYGIAAESIPAKTNTLDEDIARMRTLTQQGKPLVLGIESGLNSPLDREYPGHAIVVVGFSDEGDQVYINDPDNDRGIKYGGETTWSIQLFRQVIEYTKNNRDDTLYGYAVGSGLTLPSPPANNNLVRNGDFRDALIDWTLFGAVSAAVYSDVVLHFHERIGDPIGAVVQRLPYRAAPNSPFEVRLDLGNKSNVPKTASVYLHGPGAGWERTAITCRFELAPNTPLRTYVMRGLSAPEAWDNLQLEVWPGPADGVPDLLMDNVSVQYRPDIPPTDIRQGGDCFVPVEANTNLVRNGDFGNALTDWTLFGAASAAVYTDSVLHFHERAGDPVGAVVQRLPYRAAPNSPFEVRLDLGNKSNVLKTASVYLHGPGAGWERTAIACRFELAPNTPFRTYVMQGLSASEAWDNLQLEVWPGPADGVPDLLMDNVSVAYNPTLTINQTECSASAVRSPEASVFVPLIVR